MINGYEIKNTQLDDLEEIFRLFEHSIKYQERHGYPVWKNYDKEIIVKDIENKKSIQGSI